MTPHQLTEEALRGYLEHALCVLAMGIETIDPIALADAEALVKEALEEFPDREECKALATLIAFFKP